MKELSGSHTASSYFKLTSFNFLFDFFSIFDFWNSCSDAIIPSQSTFQTPTFLQFNSIYNLVERLVSVSKIAIQMTCDVPLKITKRKKKWTFCWEHCHSSNWVIFPSGNKSMSIDVLYWFQCLLLSNSILRSVKNFYHEKIGNVCYFCNMWFECDIFQDRFWFSFSRYSIVNGNERIHFSRSAFGLLRCKFLSLGCIVSWVHNNRSASYDSLSQVFYLNVWQKKKLELSRKKREENYFQFLFHAVKLWSHFMQQINSYLKVVHDFYGTMQSLS